MSEALRRIDARTESDSDGNSYFVVFCSRISDNPTTKPGHAFVVWGVEDQGQQMSAQKAFGFYPKPDEETKALFQTIGGQMVDEATRDGSSGQLTARLIVQVNKQAFLSSQSQIDAWRTSDYNLYARNCISFVRAVAVSLGLFPPDVGALQIPTSYLERLIRETTSGGLGVERQVDDRLNKSNNTVEIRITASFKRSMG